MKILIIILSCIFVYFLYEFLTRKYVNPFTFIHVFGKKGCGKTTLACRFCIEHLKKGWTVYTNIDEMHIKGLRHIDSDKFGDFVPDPKDRKILCVLDEVGMIWDARDFKTFKKSTRDLFKLQRHRHIKIISFSQNWDIDKKLRDLTDSMILQTKFLRVFTLSRYISRIDVLTESQGEQESRLASNLKFIPLKFKLTFIPRYVRYFDSFAVPDVPVIPYSVDE